MLSILSRLRSMVIWVFIMLLFGSFGLQINSHPRDASRVKFVLTDHNGKLVTEKYFAGYFLLIFFGYSHCPDICPINLSAISHTMNLLGKDSVKIQPIFITLDPERDTPETLKPFVRYFHPRMIGLTGNAQQIRETAKTFFVRYKHSEVESKNGYLLDHTAVTYFIGTEGEGLLLFPHDTPASEMVAALQTYITQ